MAEQNQAENSGTSKRRKWVLFGIPVVSAVALFFAGIIFWGGFNTAMEATNTLGFCRSCHEMEDTVYQEYKQTIHYQNRTGVRATCSDCHVPDPWIHKFVRKIQASKELYHKAIGSIDTKEKFEAKRLTLAKRVWKAMKETDSRECRNCHNFESMNPEFQRPRARKQHLNAFENGATCIDCHKGIAHKQIRDQLPEEELEALEKPEPFYKREIPEVFLAGLKHAEQKDAETETKLKADQEAAAAHLEQKITAAVEAALAQSAAAKASSPTHPQPSSGGGASNFNVDWTDVKSQKITLFYPGQASFEWIQTGKDHGGARAFLKGGDRCANCHIKEVKDMGAKIVTGEKAEETPIPDKRPWIDMDLQATHDGVNLYLKFQWANGPHNPVPFVEGGKMDPENQAKLAVMIAGNDVELADQAGCWVTCHHDSRYMPHQPDKAMIDEAGAAVEGLDLSNGVTKYLSNSRTKVEVKGRRGKKRGGWQKLKENGELEDLKTAGSLMDLLRFNSGAAAENGYVLEARHMSGGIAAEAEGSLNGEVWTVVLVRPLKSDQPGDINIEAGKTYTVGFAIHDDYTNARFHHVSLEFYLGLDDAEAEINVTKQ